MKSSKTVRNWGIAIVGLFLVGFAVFKMANDTSESLPVTSYYGYDRAIPLKDSVEKVIDTTELTVLSVSFNSIHDKRVTGLLSLPKKSTTPSPVIILMHGLGDHKAVDYVEYGNGFFLKNGFAVLRLDISDHGDRENVTYDFDLTGDYKYWTRNVIAQTVFDLRRAVDFIETRKELDSKRIGYYGISLGGIIGTVFCGVENRVKVPVIALAGGQLNLLYKEKAFSREAKDFMGIVEPLNFVKHIAPRPFLMLNAKNDEVVHPAMSKLLFNAAEEPKEMVWYDAKHKDAPIDRIYGDGLNWFKEYL
ncbi:alpha/beta hydrolase [Ulvibacterium marinum]|uniref:alpha/beta hydrolase n=1 Tax=Ulvibacterium marinum TaxID=2419782 RepID=UPI0024945848|nr:acetylxylan esterase [Ulvibacterium marinum]